MSKMYQFIQSETLKAKKSFVASFKKWQKGKTHLEMGTELKEELEKMSELLKRMFLSFSSEALTLGESHDLEGDVFFALTDFRNGEVSDKDVAIAYLVKMIRPKVEKQWAKLEKESRMAMSF